QSHYFSSGTVVTWAEAGVGAVATQSFADPAYGKLGLDLMRVGRSARDALDGLVAADRDQQLRQVAMVDAKGTVAAHTGARCIKEAGHTVGEGFSVQANMMHRNTVWGAMADAYRNTSGDLADRLMAALEAAEAEGGDIRGMQSAAMLIAGPEPDPQRPWLHVVDLRVDDSPQPLKELRRILQVHNAYRHPSLADQAFARGDCATANREYMEAEGLIGDNPEVRFWHAVTLVNANRIDEALPLFKIVFAFDPRWLELTERLRAVGRLQADDSILARI